MADYYPFGSILRTAKTNEETHYRYGYQGEFSEEDEETGWNSFEAREYDPIIGRWISPDPKRQFASPYVAFGNNPIRMVDPDGEESYPIDVILKNYGYSSSNDILFPEKTFFEKAERFLTFTFDLVSSRGTKGVETFVVAANEVNNIANDFDTRVGNAALSNMADYSLTLQLLQFKIEQEVRQLNSSIEEFQKNNSTGFHTSQIEGLIETKWSFEDELNIINIEIRDLGKAIELKQLEPMEAGIN